MQITGLVFATLISFAPAPQAGPPAPAPAPPKTAPQPPPQTKPPAPAPAAPQTRRPAAAARTRGPATLALHVSAPDNTPIGGVAVTLQGPVQRSGTTEGGRLAFENLPTGTYRLRFEREGFVTLERELIGRGGAPIDVNVTLTPAPPPPAPPPPATPPPPPMVEVDPIVVHLPAFAEKNSIGRDPEKTSPIGCSNVATATLVQLRGSQAEQTHDDWDEFLYVVAGQGSAHIRGRDQPLTPGVLLMVPRGVARALTASGRNPLVTLSIRPGDRCVPPAAAR